MNKPAVKPALAVLAIFIVIGCGGRYGSLSTDSAVERSFAAGTLKQNLTYYYLGSEDSPFVYIGVDKGLVLDDIREWRLIEPQTAARLQTLVKLSYDRWRGQGYTFRGFRMLDQDGRYAGDWYSVWDIDIVNPVLYSKDQSRIVIFPPPFPSLETGGRTPGGVIIRR